MISLKKWSIPLRALAVITLLGASAAFAEPPAPYTIDTKTGLSSRTNERSLYEAVWRMVSPAARALKLNEADTECAKATAAEALIKATVEALQGNMFGLGGHEAATRFFKQGHDDWCNKAGGMRGAKAIAPYAAQAESFVRPFLQEHLESLRSQKVDITPAAVAAAIAAALVALPVLAPL